MEAAERDGLRLRETDGFAGETRGGAAQLPRRVELRRRSAKDCSFYLCAHRRDLCASESDRETEGRIVLPRRLITAKVRIFLSALCHFQLRSDEDVSLIGTLELYPAALQSRNKGLPSSLQGLADAGLRNKCILDTRKLFWAK